MIDKLQKVARTIRFLRWPAVVIGVGCVALFVYTLVTSASAEGDRYLIPSIVGLCWALSTYALITAFHRVPPKADSSSRLFHRLLRALHRAWYWLIALVFFATSIGVIAVTWRLVIVWLADFGNNG